MKICLQPDAAKKVTLAFKSGELSIGSLIEMTTEDRRDTFKKYMDEREAKFLNTQLEKAMVSQQQSALINWFKNNVAKELQKKTSSDIYRKIEELSDVLDPENSQEFLADLVEESLGVAITQEEGRKLFELHKKMVESYGVDETFGVPEEAWWKARKEAENYIDSITPTNNVRVFFSTIGRGAMLASIKSPITNIVGNTVMGLGQALERRAESTTLMPSHGKLMKDYMKKTMSIFNKTGFDITRMYTLGDTRRTLGEEFITSQGPGAVRAVGRFFEDTVFKYGMSAPDVLFSAYAFSESVSFYSVLQAKKEGLEGKALEKRSEELFKEATQIEPPTEAGQTVRFKSVANAEYATFQNKSWYSKMALGTRDYINQASGDLRLGDNLIPFAKTPANVIGASVDSMGVSAVRALKNLPNAVKEAKNGNPDGLRTTFRLLVRSGLGLTAAFIIAGMFEPDDFIGEYPTNPTERKLLETRNASPNSIRMGNKWVSLDYFGPIGAPLVGIMYAKKYGDDGIEKSFRFLQGVGAQLSKIPGFDQLNDILEFVKTLKKDDGFDIKEVGISVATGIADFIAARTIPAIISDLAKSTDDFERKRDYTRPEQAFQTRIPGWRQELPVKKDAFGQPVETEGAVSVILFGSRLKTDKTNKIAEEYVRLGDTGNLPTLSDIERTSEKVKRLKEQKSEGTYNAAMQYYYKNLSSSLNTLINSKEYKEKDDDGKKNAINNTRSKVLEDMLKKYGYVAPKK